MAIKRLQLGSPGLRILDGRPRPTRAAPSAPLPEVERRLRLAFPEVWRRYEDLAAYRGLASRQQRSIDAPRRRDRSSPTPPLYKAAPTH